MSGTVLLIEDNETNRYLITFILEKRGYCVLHAENGATALRKAEEVPLSLILLDIQLPDMNGYQVAAKLRQIGCLNNVPIVAVTSYAMVGDRERILAAGCNGYIEKPIDPMTFADEVASYSEASHDARKDGPHR